MKIGILSYPLNNNYGCYLQAFALKSVLESWGHQVIYIHRRHTVDFSLYSRIKYFIKAIVKDVRYFKYFPLFWCKNTYENQYMLNKGANMLFFFDRYLSPHTAPFYDSKSLKTYCDGSFDAIIVGSDQVWRADLLKNIEDYFLTFLTDESTIRIAYAASFGSCTDYPADKKDICGDGYAKFNAVSVREEDAINLIKKLGWAGPVPCHVLDPTLLLDVGNYNKLLKEPSKKNVLFCYILDSSVLKTHYINLVSASLELRIYNIIEGRENDDFMFPSIESWLQGIRDSKYVITDSFHGTVFSIIFHVPFTVILNKKRGVSRLYSLLRRLGLEDRMVDENSVILLNTEIDWNHVNQILFKEKEFSLEYLQKSLSQFNL